MNNSNLKQSRTIILFLIVPMLLILLFSVLPLGLMIYYSFTDWDGFSTTYNYVGFENYLKFFKPDNLEPFKLFGYYFLSAILQFCFGILLAVYVFFQKRFKKILFIVTILPVFINTVAVGLMFILFFQPEGMFDQLLHIITFNNYEPGSIFWIGNQKIINYTIAIISFWRFTSFTFLLLFSGLNSVDKNLIKAAYQAGASKYQIARYVLLPNIKISINLVIIMLLIGTITAVEIPMVISKGALKTKTVLMRLNEVAFSMRDYGLASVISLVIITIILVILGFRLREATNEK